MVHALHEAQSLGMQTVQVFTKNQQQWKPTPLDAGVARDWCATLRAWKWDEGGPTQRGRVVSHASYLINLASPNDELWEKSIALMRVEIERCELLNIAYLVHHPGAFTTSSRDEGLARIARAYARLHKDLPGFRTCMCLEGTAGSGTNLGSTFEDLRDLRTLILQLAPREECLGFCLDTCHLHAAGHDMSSKTAASATLARFDAMCGLSNVRVWHLNDSKGGLGSHLDRHDNIGAGCVGGKGPMPPPKGTPATGEPTPQTLAESGFAAVLAQFAARPVPLILETPKEDAKLAKTIPLHDRADSQNLRRLRGILAYE
jgi:deoxyribonuclease-4